MGSISPLLNVYLINDAIFLLRRDVIVYVGVIGMKVAVKGDKKQQMLPSLISNASKSTNMKKTKKKKKKKKDEKRHGELF